MKTVLQKFRENVTAFGSSPCLMAKRDGVWREISWSWLLERITSLAAGLKRLGVRKGDLIAIYSNTRYEWTLIDLAILSLGAISVPIYHTLGSDHVSYILNHSSAKIVFIEDRELLEKLEVVRAGFPSLEAVVLIEGDADRKDCLSLADMFSEDGPPFGDLIADLKPEDIATCVYTSGTTGEPKGVELTHSNISAEVEALRGIFHFRSDEIGLLFLPLAHVIARVMQFYQLSQGCITAYAESIEKLAENILEVRPHFMVVVPRVMEKIYDRIRDRAERAPAPIRFLFTRALRLGGDISRRTRQQRGVSLFMRVRYWLVRKLFFAKIDRSMGGRLGVVISGGAPLDKAIAEFFHAVGLLILEGYGLTETIAAVTINRPNDFKFGTVGKPIDDVRIRIIEDGEILVKGPQVFKGYRLPVSTDEGGSFYDGWFKTGDIGEFSRDGFLRITGRKKELIITAAGKNIAPQRVENVLKSSPYINDIVVFGDRRKYLSALITLNYDRVREYAEGRGVRYSSVTDLINNDLTQQLIKDEVEIRNRQLARHETIKRFCILDHIFSQETGELTPTLKPRRSEIYKKYREEIEKMYV